MQLASLCYVADRIEVCPSLGSKEALAKKGIEHLIDFTFSKWKT